MLPIGDLTGTVVAGTGATAGIGRDPHSPGCWAGWCERSETASAYWRAEPPRRSKRTAVHSRSTRTSRPSSDSTLATSDSHGCSTNPP